jgi:hypothetical protein
LKKSTWKTEKETGGYYKMDLSDIGCGVERERDMELARGRLKNEPLPHLGLHVIKY